MRLPISLLALCPTLAVALCECGFSAQNPNNQMGQPWIFTDMLESDFTKIRNISQVSQWVREEFNVSAEAGRGKYGKQFIPSNIIEQPASNRGETATHNQDQAGLVLRVDSALSNNSVGCAELDTARQDLLWGSFRAGMKIPDVSGTCAAFFWYFNDTQEIDMEFLTQEFDRDQQIFPVNLVIQSRQSLQAGYDASKTGTYQRVNLTFDPTMAFHEYRFDFVPGQVFFFADSTVIAQMDGTAVPNHPGHIILQNWSNGNPLWSGGPPTTDAYLTVSYFKAYFNSSDASRQDDFNKRCASGSSDEATCIIPNVTAANASTGGAFFSDQDDGQGQGGDQTTPSAKGQHQQHDAAPTLNRSLIILTLQLAVGLLWLGL